MSEEEIREYWWELQLNNVSQKAMNYFNSLEKEIERLKTELQDTKEHLGEFLHEQEKENERLNNIINKALEKSKCLQYRFGYVLDDLIYLLMQGSDKE